MSGKCVYPFAVVTPWQIREQVKVAVFVKMKKKAKVCISLGINDGEMCPPD